MKHQLHIATNCGTKNCIFKAVAVLAHVVALLPASALASMRLASPIDNSNFFSESWLAEESLRTSWADSAVVFVEC